MSPIAPISTGGISRVKESQQEDSNLNGVQLRKENCTRIQTCLGKIRWFLGKIFHKNRSVTSNTTETAGKVSNNLIPGNNNQSSWEILLGSNPKELLEGELFKTSSLLHDFSVSKAPLLVGKVPLSVEKQLSIASRSEGKWGNEKTSSVIKLAKGLQNLFSSKLTPEANLWMEPLGEALVNLLKDDPSVNKKKAYLRAIDCAKMVGLDPSLLKDFKPGGVEPEPIVDSTPKAFATLDDILKEINKKKESLEKGLELVKTQKGSIYSKQKLATANLFFETVLGAVNIAKIGKYQIAVDHLEQYQNEHREQFDMLDADDKEFWNSVISFLKSKKE